MLVKKVYVVTFFYRPDRNEPVSCFTTLNIPRKAGGN